MNFFLKLTTVLFISVSGTLIGQNDTSNWGKTSRYNKIYDEKTITEIKGEITAIEQIAPKKGASMGIHITIKTDAETYSVHLGPKWYLDKQAVQLKIGDKVIVQGSKVSVDSKQTIIAKDVVKDGNTLILRDQTGKPVWAGKGNR